MFKSTVSTLLALCCFLTTGCQTGPQKSKPVHFAGHYTLGSMESIFVPLAGHTAFFVSAADMPSAVYTYLRTQPQAVDYNSQNGNSNSALVSGEGYIIATGNGTPRFHATRIDSTQPAMKEYIAALSRRQE